MSASSTTGYIAAVMLCIALWSSVAESSAWVMVTRSNGGNDIHFVDRESVRHTSKNIVSATSKIEKEVPERYDTRHLKRLVGREEWDCQEKMGRSLSLTMYFTDGTRATEDAPTGWNTIVQGTVEATIWDFLCR
ncbi:MAG TPA: surface-adhesin E family protein [Dissulfurispiraceae bacterium]|nr:surface-adhesin E family protein [Dissulfurispiraceae bacterium]